jgi:serine/threonine protein kinase
MTGGAGTPRYMAPEVARMERSYGFPADVYSFTILLWQIITNRVPYASIGSGLEFTTRVVNGNLRPTLKYVDSDLLKSCFLQVGHRNQKDDLLFVNSEGFEERNRDESFVLQAVFQERDYEG